MKYVLITALILSTLFYSIKYLTTAQKIPVNGLPVPPMTGVLRNGRAFDLKTLEGSFVLVHFWGSWCAPCIEEIPQWRKVYQKYHTKTFASAQFFEIVSFGMEDDSLRWNGALDRLKPEWTYQLTDLKNAKSPVAQRFGVQKIPADFLVNPKGVIVGVNLTPEETDKYLSEQ